MNLSFLFAKKKIQKEKHPTEEMQESIYPRQHELNIGDGDEFLDDGIRMIEQPYEKKDQDSEN